MASSSAKTPAATAAKSYDPARWRQYVRLSCLEIAASQATSAHDAARPADLVERSRILEKYVLGD